TFTGNYKRGVGNGLAHSGRRPQEHRVVLNLMAQVGYDRNQPPIRQIEHTQDLQPRHDGLDSYSFQVQTVILAYDLGSGYTFSDQLASNCVGICNYPMCQPKSSSFDSLLQRRAEAVCLTFVGHASRNLCQCRCRHSKNVCVETVGVYN